MNINKETVQNLKPCEDRLNNYIKNYGDNSFDLEQFLKLDKITYSDKVWVVTRLFTKEQNVKWSIKCAKSVLYLFENKYPNDKRPRLAIEAAETNINADAAYAAAYAAADAYAASAAASAAAYAAYAAYTAAAYAAYAAANADAAADAAAAAYAAAADADADAAYAAADAAAADAEKDQEELNLQFMLEAHNDSI